MERASRWAHLERLLAVLLYGAFGVLWSQGTGPITAAAGAAGAFACACALAMPREVLSTASRRALAALGLAAVVAGAMARLFPRPDSPAALATAFALSSALLATAAGLGGGRAVRALFLAACAGIAALHLLILPRLGADGNSGAGAARHLAQASLGEAVAWLGRPPAPSGGAAALWLLWLAVAQVAFPPAVSGVFGAGRGPLLRDRARLAVLLASLAAAVPASLALAARSRPGRFAAELGRAAREHRAEMAALRRLGAAGPPADGGVRRLGPLLDAPRSLVVVIGGPSARDHWSLYGYPRPTNGPLAPWAGELVLFTDVVAPHALAVPALEGVLAGATGPPGDEPRRGSPADLVSVARAAGYEVAWVSARSGDAAGDGLDRLMMERADRRALVEPPEATRDASDEDLVPALARLLERRGPRSIAFVHLPAPRRDPCPAPDAGRDAVGALGWLEAGRLFGRRGVDVRSIDCHDRAVARQSAALAGVLALARRQGVDTVLYLAERGASPGSARSGGALAAGEVEIPLLFWLDERHWSRHPAAAAALRANRDAPAVSSDLFDTIQDLAGAGGPGFAPERSLLRDGYRPRPRVLLGGRLDYDRWSAGADARGRARANLLELARRHPALHARVWAHRVDTLGKLQQTMPLFAGVELDVAWQDGRLYVHHPPAENLGIELRDYLQVAGRRPDLGLWFDLKVPPAERAGAAVRDALEALDRGGRLRRRCILELPPGPEHAALARSLAGAGWRVAYQLPGEDDPAPARSPADPAGFLRQAREQVSTAGYAFLSYDVGMRTLADALAQDPRLRALPRITWDLSLDASGERFLSRLEGFDESVVLVAVPSPWEN